MTSQSEPAGGTPVPAFLSASATERDVVNTGSRFWFSDPDLPEQMAFGSQTAAIIDEDAGGAIAYCHVDNAPRLVEALQAFTGNT